MKIKILAVDKVREPFIQQGIQEFSKRVRNFEVVEVKKSEKTGECKKILESLKNDDFVIVLDPTGKDLSSEDFAAFLKEHEFKNIVFVVGGAFGLTDEVRNRADFLLSFSKMTLPHELCRLFLAEQIYRAQSINDGKSYHK